MKPVLCSSSFGQTVVYDIEGLKKAFYDVYPAVLTKEENAELQNTVSAILQEAGAVLGEYNIEGFFTREGKCMKAI